MKMKWSQGKAERVRLFTKALSGWTSGNGFELKEGRVRLDVRKNHCTVRVAGHKNKLLREIDAPALQVLRVRSFEQP